MQGGQLRRHDGGVVAVADDGPGQRAEDLQDPCGGGRGAGAVFGVEGQVPDSGFGHGVAQFAFDEGVDEQCYVEAEAEGVDAGVVFQLGWGGAQHALEGGVAAFEAGLALVSGQQPGRGEVLVVGDEGIAAI